MKKIIILILILLLGSITLLFPIKKTEKPLKTNKLNILFPTIKINVQEKKSIFVPDWSLQKDSTPTGAYDRWIYFGSADSLMSLPAGNDNIWYTVKISEIPNRQDWEKEVQKTVDIANNYKLNGIVLDLEIAGLPTDNTVTQINEFVEYFYTQAKQYYIKLAVAVYGDTFYRRRPYDLRSINQNSDEIMIMAYDFHKSRGEPGPNFPFQDTDLGGYNFKQMIADFLTFVPAEKLTVIFGMYGYDWIVDEKKRPIAPAKALTLNEIKNKYYNNNNSDNDRYRSGTVIKRDEISKETEINYTISAEKPDTEGVYRIEYHIVWFEDEQSVEVKLQHLKEKGIGGIAYWAYGYF